MRKCTLWLEFRERVENNDKLLHSIINGEAIELPFPEEKSTKRPLGEESELDDSADDLIVTKSDSKTKHSLIRCPVEDCGRELVGFRKFEDHCLTHITSTTVRTSYFSSPIRCLTLPLPLLQNIRCPICRLVYKRSDNFRKHMYVHTNQKFQCSDCDRWFNNPKSLNDHLRIVHKIYARDDPEDRRCKGARNTIIPKGIKCPVCQLELKSFKEYDEHINTHISREDRSCPVCQKKINHFGNLKGHIYSHTDVKFTCQFCPEKFVHPKKYRNHIKVMHKKEFYYAKNEDVTDEEGEFPTNCILCLNSILTKEELIAHMLEEHPDEQKLCTKCGITLSSEHELKEHSLKKHSGDWIDCDECDQKFNSVSSNDCFKVSYTSLTLSGFCRCRYSENTKGFTAEKNETSARNVECPSAGKRILRRI